LHWRRSPLNLFSLRYGRANTTIWEIFHNGLRHMLCWHPVAEQSLQAMPVPSRARVGIYAK